MQEKQQLTLSGGVKILRTKVAKSDQFLSELVGSLCKRSAGATQANRERRCGQSSTRCTHQMNSQVTGRSTSERKMVLVHALSFFSTSQALAIIHEKVGEKFPITATQLTSQEPSLSYEKMNALWNAAGYVPQHLKKRLTKSAHPMKNELTLCLLDLLQDEEEDNIYHLADWVDAVDRGGLNISIMLHTTYFWLWNCKLEDTSESVLNQHWR